MRCLGSGRADQPRRSPRRHQATGQASSRQSNPARFRLPQFDALFERQRLLVAYMPMKAHVHHLGLDLAHAALRGYRRHPFVPNFWLWVDVQPDPPG